MKIDSFSVSQNSAHSLVKEESVTESLQIWNGAQDSEGTPAYVIDIDMDRFQVTTEKSYLSRQANDLLRQTKDSRIRLIESLVYALTGKRIKFRDPGEAMKQSGDAGVSFAAPANNGTPNWGIAYDYREVRSEQESVSFASSGTVKTSDGRIIAFDMSFSMSRSYYEETGVSLRLGAAKVDPLVVAFGGGAPTLSVVKKAFDLDADGKLENISFATGNSGFLAFDKNNDGAINNGSELFGPTSGNGFSELRAYDTDKNGWIDESDEIFGKLSVLTMKEDGTMTLFSLKDVGIGAIYLNDVSTQFEMKDMAGEYGEMKSSSIFLRENGTAGTIHHIDLSI